MLRTSYLGLDLPHPLIAGASPVSKTLAGIKAAEDSGAAAIVLYSLFEEQIIRESESIGHYLEYGSESFAEALSYFPEPKAFNAGPEEYLTHILKAKEATDFPVIASLNGVSPGRWTEYARLMQQAGADALELNIYLIPTDPDVPGGEIESRYEEIVRLVSEAVDIPVAAKVGPYFSSPANMVKRLAAAGAKGVVLFNRFYQPDFDLENLDVVPSLVLSTSHELRLPLHWIGILYGRVAVDMALSTGVHTHYDVLKAMMAGAAATQMASALLKGGVHKLADVLGRLEEWMVENEYQSIQQMRGSLSRMNCPDPMAFERANYMKELASFRADPATLGIR